MISSSSREQYFQCRLAYFPWRLDIRHSFVTRLSHRVGDQPRLAIALWSCKGRPFPWKKLRWSKIHPQKERAMMLTIYGGKDFARQFRVVRNNTLQIAEDIPESEYGFLPAPNVRTVAALLTHIAVTPRMWFEVHGKQRVKTLVGFDFVKLASDVKAEEGTTRSKAEILDLLRDEGEHFAGWLDTLTPEFLAEMVTVADNTGTKSRFEQLLGAKEHEMHHRGQLMLIERQLGIVPHLTRQAEEQRARVVRARG
jgi:uncharacterized damage-inducible protein DinB